MAEFVVQFGRDGSAVFSSKGSGQQAGCPTQRAPDVWESARFTSIFLASSFSCSQAESTPAPAPVTQTVGWLTPKANAKPSLNHKFRFIVEFGKTSSVF